MDELWLCESVEHPLHNPVFVWSLFSDSGSDVMFLFFYLSTLAWKKLRWSYRDLTGCLESYDLRQSDIVRDFR